MPKHALPPKITYKHARLLQTQLGAWRDCLFQSCEQTQSCNGGPRGICAKTGG